MCFYFLVFNYVVCYTFLFYKVDVYQHNLLFFIIKIIKKQLAHTIKNLFQIMEQSNP